MAVKEYEVKKDGQVLKTYKSLPAAKQLAEKEMANVYAGGECVYRVVPENNAVVKDEQGLEAAGTVKNKAQTPDETSVKYTLTALMNVRKEPSFKAEIVKTLQAGTVVDVETLAEDWLYLTDGTFIFYDGGKYAGKSAETGKASEITAKKSQDA